MSDEQYRAHLHARIDWLAKDVYPIDQRVAEWAREWIATEQIDELRSWSFRRGYQYDLVFERYNSERDDSVYVSSDEIAYHLMSVEERASDDAQGTWVVVGFNPPHALREYEPSREAQS